MSKTLGFSATLIGSVFSALNWVIFLTAYLLFPANRIFEGNKTIEMLTFLLFFLIPFVVLSVLFQLKIIEDLDTRDKKKRVLMMLIFISFHLVLILYALATGFFDVAKLVFVLFIPAIILAVVNKFWLLSMHTSSNAASITIFSYLSGWPFHLLYIIVLLVAWSRVYEKKHTVPQVISGAIMGVIVAYFILRIFFPVGYLN